MFTPARPLTLVHAVRRPLLAPSVDDLDGDRTLGSSAVVLDGSLVASTTSTERVTHDRDLDRPGRRPDAGRTGTAVDQRRAGRPAGARARTQERGDRSSRSGRSCTTPSGTCASVDLEAYTSFAAYFTEEKSLTVAGEPGAARTGAGRGRRIGRGDGRRDRRVKAEPGADFIVDGPDRHPVAQPARGLAVGEPVTVRYVPLPISRVSTRRARSRSRCCCPTPRCRRLRWSPR